LNDTGHVRPYSSFVRQKNTKFKQILLSF